MFIADVIRQYLGWCPNARMLPQWLPVAENDATVMERLRN
jgi:hypothetical protein